MWFGRNDLLKLANVVGLVITASHVPFRDNREHGREILKLPKSHSPSVGLDRDGADQFLTRGISKQSRGFHTLGIGRVGVGHHIRRELRPACGVDH